MLAGALIGNSVGATVYSWYDRKLYVGAGGYNTYGPTLLKVTGATLGPGATANFAPYGRIAYEWNWAGQSAHVGALVLHANLSPATGDRTVDGSFGRDSYTDAAVDAGYQFLGDGTHVAAMDGVFTHENHNLPGSFGMGTSSQTVGPGTMTASAATRAATTHCSCMPGWHSDGCCSCHLSSNQHRSHLCGG